MKDDIFESSKFTAEMLENELWEVLKKTKSKSIKINEANVVIAAAKELCNLSRLRLQYRIMSSPDDTKKIKG